MSHVRLARSSVASGGFGRLAAAASRKKMKILILRKFGRDHLARGGEGALVTCLDYFL